MPSLTRPNKRREEIDWPAARERLARAAADTSQLDPAQCQRILIERARALARKPAAIAGSTAASLGDLELLHFRLARESYAIEAHYVHRVIQPSGLTRLPGAPTHLRGVTNLRGEILPVFDLREWFEVERVGPSDATRWLVLGASSSELCLWVDAVDELSAMSPRDLHRADRDRRHGGDLLHGITQEAQTILDGARLLAHPELFVGETVNARQEIAS
jgi:purine-binding chemotaxis protein CheW